MKFEKKSNKLIEKHLKEFSLVADDWFNKQDWLPTNYLFFKTFFSKEFLDKAQWSDFQEMGNHLHSFNSLAIAKGNALGNPNLPIAKYREIFNYIISKKDTIEITTNNLFKKYKGDYHLPYFGESSISELLAYAFSDKFVIYNARDVEAIKILDIEFKNIRGEKFGEKFKRYNETLAPILNSYEKIVGKRTDTTLSLELDQFFSWLYTSKSKNELGFKEIIDQVKASLVEDERFVFNETTNNYIWIGDAKGIIGDTHAHYEIIKRRKSINVELHFESKKTKDIFSKRIGVSLPQGVNWFPWNKSKSLKMEEVKLDSLDIVNKLTSDLIFLEENIGGKVRAILEKIKKPKNYWVYAPGENAKYWDTFYQEGIMGLGWNNLGDISRFSEKQEIVSELQKLENTKGSKKNDATANWDFIHRIKIGDIIIAKKGRQELLGYGIVTSDYFYDKKRKDQHHLRSMNWKEKGSWKIDHKLSLKTLTIINDYKSEDPNYEYYYESLLAYMNVNKQKKISNMHLNQILYGPPGTGKTFNTINLALKCLGENIENLTRKKIHELYDSKVESGNIVFTTFHQSMSYEDFVEGIKPSTKNNQIVYNVEDGLFKKISDEASDNIEKNMTSSVIFQDAFNQLNYDWEENEDGELKIEMKNKAFHITDVNEKHISFRKQSGGSSHVLVVKTLKDLFTAKRSMNSGLAVYYYPLIDKMKSYNLEVKETKLENFVLIIDEINRGNVSSIFGELITLIEEDKRKGNPEMLEVVLPYSKEKFSVPNNLFLLATMNTADRSVEALDTAFRRRFSFKEMLSDPMLLKNEVGGISLNELLTVMNERIEVLVDRDHTIGHAFFINIKSLDDLRNTFANNVIPLLQEYFYGDYGKMEMVIGSAFFNVKDTSKVKFAVNLEDFDAEGKVYHIIDITDKESMPDNTFKEALKKLMKGED